METLSYEPSGEGWLEKLSELCKNTGQGICAKCPGLYVLAFDSNTMTVDELTNVLVSIIKEEDGKCFFADRYAYGMSFFFVLSWPQFMKRVVGRLSDESRAKQLTFECVGDHLLLRLTPGAEPIHIALRNIILKIAYGELTMQFWEDLIVAILHRYLSSHI